MATDVVPVARAQVLAYRATVHGLETPVSDPQRCAVLGVGVQDTPAGATARLALRARSAAPPTTLADGIASDAFALVHSVRGTMHLHRAVDCSVLAAALRSHDATDLAAYTHGPFFAELAEDGVGFVDALHQVAAAMRSAMSDGRRPTKGELSSAIVPAVDPRLAPWCTGCGVYHVHDGLFRLAGWAAPGERRTARVLAIQPAPRPARSTR